MIETTARHPCRSGCWTAWPGGAHVPSRLPLLLIAAVIGCDLAGPDTVTVKLTACLNLGWDQPWAYECEGLANPPTDVSVRLSDQVGDPVASRAFDGNNLARFQDVERCQARDLPASPPDPEVSAKATRRRFTPRYKLSIVESAEQCEGPGEIGKLLRREGLYSLGWSYFVGQSEGKVKVDSRGLQSPR